MTIELYGRSNSATIWSGIVDLFEGGSWFIALVVLLASLVIPFLKLLALFYLSLWGKCDSAWDARLYKILEAIGRWSMLDIYLLAVLVAVMKLGPWTRVEPEMGAVLFLFVVIFTMIASSKLEPEYCEREKHESPSQS